MDELSNKVRELAPDVNASSQAAHEARTALRQAIADENVAGARRARPARTRRGFRLQMPKGVVAGTAAAAVVAVLVGGVVVAQNLSHNDDHVAGQRDLDLSKPLLEQLRPGEWIRIDSTDVEPQVMELPSGETDEESYLLHTSTGAIYLSADRQWVDGMGVRARSTTGVGPLGEQMVAADEALKESEGGYLSSPTTVGWMPDQEWVDALPDDGKSLLERLSGYHSFGPEEEFMYFSFTASDPLWIVLDAEQRKGVVDYASSIDGVTTTTKDGLTTLSIGANFPQTVTLRADSLLYAASTASGDLIGLPEYLPDGKSSASYTIVDSAPLEVGNPTWACGTTPLRDPVTFGEVDASAEDVLRVAGAAVGSVDDWSVVSRSDTRIDFYSTVRHSGESVYVSDPHGVVDAELLTLEIGEDGSTWTVVNWESCAGRQIAFRAQYGQLELDPAYPVTAASTELNLLYTADACEEQYLKDAVRVDDAQDADGVGIAVSSDPIGESECGGEFTIPVTVTLDEPLGDRPITDASYLSERTLRE